MKQLDEKTKHILSCLDPEKRIAWLKSIENTMKIINGIYGNEIIKPLDVSTTISPYSYDSFFTYLKNEVEEYLNIKLDNIQFEYTYNALFDTYVVNTNSNGNFKIFFDLIYETSLQEFYICILYWASIIEDYEKTHHAFDRLFFTIHETCIKGNIYEDKEQIKLFMLLKDRNDLLQVAINMQCSSLAFLILHEIAHIALNHKNSKNMETKRRQEYEADSLAYQVLLKLIYKQKENRNFVKQWQYFEEYTFMAPFITMEFFALLNDVNIMLYNDIFTTNIPSLTSRMDSLKKLLKNGDIDCSTGNEIYQYTAYIIDEFKDRVYYNLQNGNLDKVLVK